MAPRQRFDGLQPFVMSQLTSAMDVATHTWARPTNGFEQAVAVSSTLFRDLFRIEHASLQSSPPQAKGCHGGTRLRLPEPPSGGDDSQVVGRMLGAALTSGVSRCVGSWRLGVRWRS